MGRRKIEIQPITNDRNRAVTYLKRKNGLFKKAYELGVLCSVDVAIIIFNPTANKLSEYTSTDISSLIRRHSEFQGERDIKTQIDYTDGIRSGTLKGGGAGDSDEEDEDSDVPTSKAAKRKALGTKSRPARSLANLQDEKPDIDELERDTTRSHSPRQRSPGPHMRNNGSDDERDRSAQNRHRTESAARSTIAQDGRGDSWPSPRSSNRQLPGGYSNSHDLLLGNLGLPFSLGHLASQLTPQQLSNLAPHLGALASQQQQLSGLSSQQLNSLSPQHQELLALHAVKQQQQQLHLQQREQLANLQNSLRNPPNRLATLNLNLSGLSNFSNLGSLGGLSSLASLGDRELGSLGLGSSLTGLPIRKMGSGNNFPSSLTSVSSSGTSGANVNGNSTATQSSFNHPSLANNNNFNSNPNSAQEQAPPPTGADDGSWLDFLSLPAGRFDSNLSGLGPLSTLALGGAVDRDRGDSSVRRTDQPDASSIFGLHFNGVPTNNNNAANNNNTNSSFGSGVASGGGYGLGVGLGQGAERGRTTPIERSVSRGSMDVDKESDTPDRQHDRRGRSADPEDRDDESHSRKRPRWE